MVASMWCVVRFFALSFVCRWLWLICVKLMCIYNTKFWNYGSYYEDKFQRLWCRREFVHSIMTLYPKIKYMLARRNCVMKNLWNHCMVRRLILCTYRYCRVLLVLCVVFMMVVNYLLKAFLMVVRVRMNSYGVVPQKTRFVIHIPPTGLTRSDMYTVDSVHSVSKP